VNSGGQRGCITASLKNSGIQAAEIDAIAGHLTATSKDALEIENWTQALNRSGADFPYINSLKSTTGHCISAAGSIECVASVLQIHEGFIFPNINCEDLNPAITELIDTSRIPQTLLKKDINVLIKANFGFGDVNACIIFKKY
jgi:3-oxoacyl-[acyl-carrier-protein] synthase-1